MPKPRRNVARTVLLSLALILGLPLLIYAILLVGFYAGSPNVARNYMQELNDALPTEGEQAWPGMLAALSTQHQAPEDVRAALDRTGYNFAELTQDAAAWLAAHPDHVPSIRAAAHTPRLGVRFTDAPDAEYARALNQQLSPQEPSENPLLWAVLLPHLSVTRDQARTLAAHSTIAAELGHADEVIANVRAIVALAEHANNPPFYISQLVRAQIISIAADTTIRMVHQHPERFTPEQLDELDRVLGSIDPNTLTPDMSHEHLGFDDVVQRIYTDNGRGNGRLTPEGVRLLNEIEGFYPELIPAWAQFTLSAPIFAAAYPSRRALTGRYYAYMDQVKERLATPIWQWEAVTEREDPHVRAEKLGWLAWREQMILAWIPAHLHGGVQNERARVILEGSRVALALHRYRAEQGRYPDTLEQLTPRWLDALPPDRATGEPLVYRLTNDAPLLYSVGLDRIDEGGRHAEEAWRRWRPKPASGTPEPLGDFRLYPPRPIPPPEPPICALPES